MKVLLEWNAPNKTYSETTDTEMAFVEDIASDSRTPASATQSKARYCDLLARDTSFGDESTPLHKAAAGGRYLAVHMILGALKERNSATSNGLSSAPKNSWIQRGLLARDKYGRTPLDVARHFLQIQETERDAVARWDEVAGGSADWGKCAKMLENATTENKRNSIGNPSSRNQAIPGLPLHLRRGVMACLDCTGLPGQNDNVCMTASWQASFQKALGNSASMCIVASTSVPSMPKTVASILIANTKTSSVAMNENNATRKEGIEWEAKPSTVQSICKRCLKPTVALYQLPGVGTLVCKSCKRSAK